MKYIIIPLLCLLIFVITSCRPENSIEGLWVVKQVKVDDEPMTPDARWTRFNADYTQQSGNGWFQHSYGTWSFDEKTKEIKIINENGIIDTNPPFTVEFENDLMSWRRTEEGHQVHVILEKSEALPKTFGDQLLGLWKLTEAVGKGQYFSDSFEEENQDYMFLRWDKRFVIGLEGQQIHGVYNVNGHKPELELIPYGENYKRDFWKVDFGENSITLILLNTDSLVSRDFIRIHQFPDAD